mmetsp:Transcript_95047/g.204059  ORF Transcript_95047/g.204059 Transcript_95047/m.204059 type:complete len:338 (-) Transcript_95047:413-1426(-)
MSTRCGIVKNAYLCTPTSRAPRQAARTSARESPASFSAPRQATASESDSLASSISSWSTKRRPRRWMGNSQRSPLKSIGDFSPMGKFSSDFRGCRSTSTSSMITTPPLHRLSTLEQASASSERWASCFSDSNASLAPRPPPPFLPTSVLEMPPCKSRLCSISTIFSIRLFTDSGAATTTPRCIFANSSFSAISCTGPTSSCVRSKVSVKTRFAKGAPKTSRSTFRVMSSKAEGIVCNTAVLPSARQRASMGPTTVVFPAPMIICWHEERPCAVRPRRSRTISTCLRRSMKEERNSNVSMRGSSRAAPWSAAGPSSKKQRSAPSCSAAASTAWRSRAS